MGNKTNNRILWHGNGLDSDGKAQGPPIATSADGLNGLNEGEVYINNADADPAIFIRTDAGNVVRVGGGGGGGADYTREEINNLLKKKVDTAFFAKLFGLMGADGGEISVNDVDTEASSLQSRLGLWTEKWISVKGANPDAGGGGGGGGGDGTLAGLTDVSLGALQDGQSLVWSASAQKWVNRTVDAGLDEAALSQYLTSNHYATESYVDGKLDGKVDAVFFAKLLAAIAGDGSEIAVNDMETAIASIKVKFGLWSESYVSVKGDNPDAGGTPSGATSLSELSDVSLGTLQSGQVLTWNGSKWVNKAVETGLDEAALGQYLLAHGYLTDTAAAGKYALRTVSITAGTGLTGGGNLSANVTLGLEAVGTAGTYVKVTVDAYGRVTGHGSLAAGDIPALSISKITGLQSALDGKLDASVFEDLFEKVSLEGGGYAIRAKYGLYSDDWVSVMGANPDAGGTVSGASSLDELSDVALSGLQDGQVLAYDTATQRHSRPGWTRRRWRNTLSTTTM